MIIKGSGKDGRLRCTSAMQGTTWSEAREVRVELSVATKRFGIQSPDDQRRQRWQIETAADLCSRLAAHGASANQRWLNSLQKPC